MEAYKLIKNNVKVALIAEEREDLAKISNKVIDVYFRTLIDTLFEYGIAYINPIRTFIYIKTRPITYETRTLHKNMFLSKLKRNQLFEIKMESKSLRYNKFTFKAMKSLRYSLKKRVLDTEKVHEIINNYEKNLL